jgi:hypothetical protein
MRCTEGVWLSITPTRDYLVVAIDFEGKPKRYMYEYVTSVVYIGVHSIERSAQEGDQPSHRNKALL